MLVAPYPTKAALKKRIGKHLRHFETGIYPEYKHNGTMTVVGPSSRDRKWYAIVTMVNGKIAQVI